MTTSPSTVLVVDDDQEIRQAVMDVLRRAGYAVVEAADGAAAVQAAMAVKPDLVFLDMTMPGMDGAEVAVELKRRMAGRAMPLVALSAGRDPADRQRALQAGCSVYLTKPCAPSRIREVVETMLAQSRGDTKLGS